MFMKRDNQPFDPFLVGPPPVVSKNSRKSQAALSKAINAEMVEAKHGVATESRINAGAQNPNPPSPSEKGISMDVIMPVRKRRSVSQSSESSSSNVVSLAASQDSLATQAGKSERKNTKPYKRNGLDTHASDRTESSVTLTQKRDMRQPANARNGGKRFGAGGTACGLEDQLSIKSNASRATVRSKASVQLTDNYSRVSVGSKASRAQAGVHQLDHVSRVSVRSTMGQQQADNISRVSVGSKASRAHQSDRVSRVSVRAKSGKDKSDAASKGLKRQPDNISHASIKSNVAELQADAISHVSTKSKATQRQPDNVSRVSVATKAPDAHADNASHVSAKSKNKERDVTSKQLEPNNWPITAADDVRLGSKRSEREDFVMKDRLSSLATTKSLTEKTVELSDRLKAGNENLHNRFHSLIRMHTNTAPLRLCREDRMSLWLKDSVLS